ncbi:MAG: oxidoreductase [Bacteroidetes bacterium]|jgi:3-oxoacyl-[acyl-carrier protein] reductase|nr:oxidoreductase [Bacteroidota bacterium]
MTETTILITGSRKGIGRYLAEYYIQKNCKVIGFSRETSDLNAANYEHFCVDIGDEQQVKDAFSAIRKKYGQLDVLINCAGISPAVSLFILTPHTALEKAFRTNVIGTMGVCREAVKMMMKKNSGRIINMSSMAAKHEIIGDSVYAPTKAAINSFTRVLAKEVNKNGITCNAIAPAAIETDMSTGMNQEVLQKVLDRNAITTYGKMEDVSNATDWLIQESSNGITGQIIYLGGA